MVPMTASDGGLEWERIRAFAQDAEAVGLDSIWVCDHFLSSPAPGQVEGIHEGWTLLAALAASTYRVELGQLVTCVSFRSPGLLAKMAVTLDSISSGRLLLGLGAGWYDEEYRAFGYASDHRFSRLEEAVAIVAPLVRGECVTFHGRYHRVDDAMLLPGPDRRIPILIAADRPRALRLTARHADAWNTAWYRLPDDRLRRQLASFDEALAAEGRDPSTIRRTVGIETPLEELPRALEAHAELGFDDAIVLLQPMTPATLDALAAARR
jgi:alkanesulfonate monooxygenase SsuD/methylene tetrahydromethanopterin reductase-like flavin-dependent oxidoreductase (luciferase family)